MIQKSKVLYTLPYPIILTALAAIFIFQAIPVRFIQDDSFTAFRFVKNLVDGNGLVFNPGERVEGYTNFLWVLILSPFQAAKINLESAAQILSILFSLLLISVTYHLADKTNLLINSKNNLWSHFVDIWPALILSVTPPLLYWGVSGMETSLFVSLFLLMVVFAVDQKSKQEFGIPFLIFSLLCALTRPEGLALIGIFSIHKIAFIAVKKKLAIKQVVSYLLKTRLLVELLILFGVIGIYLLIKTIYYGYPFPNTFYAKTDFSFEFLLRGLKYFANFFTTYTLYGVLLFVPVYLFRFKTLRYEVTLFYTLIIAWIILVILIGGDVLPMNRFFITIYPLVLILAAAAANKISVIIDRYGKITGLLTKLSFSLFFIFFTCLVMYTDKAEMMNHRAYETGLVKKMKIYAQWIKHKSVEQNTKPKVALSTIGAFSFYSDAYIIDLVGLTDKYIAHNPEELPGIDNELPVLWKERRYNAGYVMNNKPDFIIFPAGAKPSAFAECAVFMQKDFYENYYTQIFYSESMKQMLPIFTRKENVRKSKNDYCDPAFMKYYIEANNLFLKMTESGDKKLYEEILSKCDQSASECPDRIADAITLKGMAAYHIGEYEESEKYLDSSIQLDSTSTIARFYMRNIYNKQGNIAKAIKIILDSKKYSPDAFPNFIN